MCADIFSRESWIYDSLQLSEKFSSFPFKIKFLLLRGDIPKILHPLFLLNFNIIGALIGGKNIFIFLLKVGLATIKC